MSQIVYPVIKFLNVDLLLDKEKSYLSADYSSGTGITIELDADVAYAPFANGNYLLVGEFGQSTAEIARVSSSSGTTITLTAALQYSHPSGTPIYNIDRNQVEFSRATTVAGTKSALATREINASQLYTTYEDTTNTTGFGFARAVNSADTTYSNYSESFPYAGYAENSLKKIFDSALFDLGYTDDNGQPKFTAKVSREAAFRAAQDCQLELFELRYRWSYLTNFNVTISEITVGEDSYALPDAIGREDNFSSVLAVRLGGRKDMDRIDKQKLNEYREDTSKTTLGAAITSTGNTTITLTDGSDFATSGSIQVVVDDQDVIDVIAYTGKSSTDVLTGVTGIAETVSNGATVWQGATFDEPLRYTIYEDTIVIDPPPAVAWEDRNLIADLYERPTLIDDLADETQFPAAVIKPYVTWKLGLLRFDGDVSRVDTFRQLFELRKKEIIEAETHGQRFRFTPHRRPNTITSLQEDTIDDSDTDTT